MQIAEHENGQLVPMVDGARESPDCPDELYNLTKLAEVSLAAANGTLMHPSASFLGCTYSEAYSQPQIGSAPVPEVKDGSDGRKSVDPESADDHECPECGKRYSTSSNLARHRQTHRSLGDKKARRCPHCDKVYVSIPAYSMHVRTHNQGCKCHFCGKCFSRPWLLQGHIRTHTGNFSG